MDKYRALPENPFFLLKATPRDDEHDILNNAVEQKLLFGTDTEEAQQLLLHPNSRLTAEIAYLPDLPDKTIEEIREYLSSEAGESAFPDLAEANPLARLNAVSDFLADWPVENDTRSAEAAFASILQILNEIKTDNVIEAINRDRSSGRMPPVGDTALAAEKLREHTDDILKRLAKRCSAFDENEYAFLRLCLALRYCDEKDPLYRSPAVDHTVNDILEPREVEKEQQLREAVQKSVDSFGNFLNTVIKPGMSNESKASVLNLYSNEFRKRTDEVIQNLLAWGKWTAPERMISQAKAFMANDVEKVCDLAEHFAFVLVHDCLNIRDSMAILKALCFVFPEMSVTRRNRVHKNLQIMGADPDQTGSLFVSLKEETEKSGEGIPDVLSAKTGNVTDMLKTASPGMKTAEKLPLTAQGLASLILSVMFGILFPAVDVIAILLGIKGILACVLKERRGIGWAAAGIIFGIIYLPVSLKSMNTTSMVNVNLAIIAAAVLFSFYLKTRKK